MTIDPKPQPGDDEWRRRFILINMVRIGATAVALLGLAIWHTSILRPGGWVEVGLPVAVIGVLVSFLVPLMLARRWRTPTDQ